MPELIHDTRDVEDILDGFENRPDVLVKCREIGTGLIKQLCVPHFRRMMARYKMLAMIVPHAGDVVLCDCGGNGCCERAKVTK